MLELARKAYEIATEKHRGQKYGEREYIFHLSDVVHYLNFAYNKSAMYLTIDKYTLLAAGWLHDVLEDTDTSYEYLVQEVGKEVADVVLLLTKKKGKDYSYEEYIENIKKDKYALEVKRADTYCNLSRSMDDWNSNRVAKYLKQFEMLYN